MLVKNIIIKVLEFMEKHEVIKSINAGDIVIGEEGQEIQNFVNYLNLVRNEIATEYIPNVKIEKVAVKNDRVDFSSLTEEVIKVLSVKDNFGNSLKFESFDDHILVAGTSVEVKYNASPIKLSFNDEFASTIPERVYAYGIMRENAIVQTLFEDAGIWEERFLNSLQALERKKNETIIARRRWF